MKKTILLICFFVMSVLSRAQVDNDKVVTIVITEPNALTLSIITQKDPSAFGDTNGLITVDIAGGTASQDGRYSVQWRDSNNQLINTTTAQVFGTSYRTTLSSIGAGTYTLTAYDNAYASATAPNNLGCSISSSYTLIQPELLEVSITQTVFINCNGDETGSLTADASGGVLGTSYYYKWYLIGPNGDILQNQTTPTIANLKAGRYKVKVTDDNQVSTVSDVFDLLEPDLLKFTSTQTNISCYGESNGTINVIVSGGIPPYSYSWYDLTPLKNESEDGIRTGLGIGTYFLKVTDSKGCSINNLTVPQGETAGNTITQPHKITITSGMGDVQNPTAANGNDGSIKISISGGTVTTGEDYLIQWTKDSINYSTQEDLNGIEEGIYIVTVTDSNCTESKTYTIIAPELLTVSIAEQQTIACFNETNGELKAIGNGGVPLHIVGYTYEWQKEIAGNFTSIGQSTQTAVGLGIGVYKVIITDNNGIPAEDIITISQPDPLVLSFTKQDVLCKYDASGSIDIEVSGGTPDYTFSWTNSNGLEVATSGDIYDLAADTYHLQVTDGRNCVLEQAIEILEPTNILKLVIDLELHPSAFQATDGAINVTLNGGTPPYSYEWTDASNSPIGTLKDISGLKAGIYKLTVTDDNECEINEIFTLIEPEILEVSITADDIILCYGETNGVLTANGSGGIKIPNVDYIYEWFKEDINGDLTSLSMTSKTISGLGAGIYSVTITDANSVTTSSLDFLLKQPNLLEASISSSEINCSVGNDGIATVNITGGTPPYDLEWSNGATTETIDQLTAGIYMVYITDAGGCKTTAQIIVEQPGDLVISVIEKNNPTCYLGNDGSISVNVTGGQAPYTYLWNTGDTTTAISNLTEGIYTVQVRDSDNNNCIAFLNIQLTDPDPVILDLGADRTLCNAQTHQIDISIDNVGATYQWHSNNGFTSNSPIVSLTEAGIYNATLTTSAGCTDSDSIEIKASTMDMDAQFLLTSQAFAQEEIVLVNTSNPLSSEVEWILPNEAEVIKESKESITLRFNLPGAYEIALHSFEGECYQGFTKPIIVEEARDLPDFGDTVTPFIVNFTTYPNPTPGVFQVKIKLQEEATVSLRMFNLTSNTPIDDRQLYSAAEYNINYNVNLPSGVYILLLETAKENQIRKIVIE